jgi:ATP-binding cassette subfamily F protein 3
MINLIGISKSYGNKDLFSAVNLRLDTGDRVGMIGGNGTGKTTIARMITGAETCDSGTIARTKNWQVGYLSQEIESVEDQILHDFVESGKPRLVKARLELESLEQLVHERQDSKLQMDYAEALNLFEEAGGYVVEAEVDRILHGLGFLPGDSGRHLKTLSGGWIMRAALARLLFQEPELLILDEPTNHLDLPALTWLEGFLGSWKGAYLVISHDRTFLNTMVDRIAEIEDGELIEYAGNYDSYVEQKERRQEIMVATLKNQEQRIAQVERFIEKNRAQKSKARQVGSRKKMLELLEAEKVDLPRRQKKVKFTFPQPERSGTPAIRLESIHKSYGETVVYRGMDFEVRRGEKVALVGPNGAGKSTLLKIAAAAIDFSKGTRKLGHNVRLHYFAQHQLEALDPNKTPIQEMMALPGWDKISWLRSLLGAMLLGEKEIETRIADLSGGEKAKLALAKMLVNPANLIMMDEPTNHLDPQARVVLENALASYSGSLVFISHDRTFINRIATRVVEVVAGRLTSYIGNYDDYMHALSREKPTHEPAQTFYGEPEPAKLAESPRTKESKEETKERKRREAALRTERKAATAAIRKKIREAEDKIAASEKKLEELHAEYGKTDLPADRYAELGKLSRAVSDYLKTLYEQWETASLELEEVENRYR